MSFFELMTRNYASNTADKINSRKQFIYSLYFERKIENELS